MSTPMPPAQLAYYEKHASDNQQPNEIATIVLCLTLSCIAVFLRFVARRRIRVAFQADDWLILIALFPCAGFATTTGLAIRYGEGRHINLIKYPEGFVKCYVAAIVVYSLTIVFVKLSILYLYHRIFASTGLMKLASIIAGLVVAYNSALIVFAFLQCIPLSKLWTGAPGGICLSTQAAYITLAVMNVVTDVMILCLPIRFVVRLQMKTTRKIQVLSAFGLGGIVCVFGIVRTYYVGQASSIDPTWTVTPGAIWSQVEISVGIISACLPVYRPLFARKSKLPEATTPVYSKPPKTPRSVPLTNCRGGFGGWSNNAASASGPDIDADERPFVELRDPEVIHKETSFTVGKAI